MRFRFAPRRSAALLPFAAAALAACACPAARAQEPLITAFAGTGANTYFFVMDFRDFAAPQSYAFGLRSSASSLTFQQVLDGLGAVPTFTTRISNSAQFGPSLNGLGFAGKEKFNVFGGENSGEPNGYWAQWNSPTGAPNSWAFNDFGIGTQTVAAGQWVGASWTADFTTVADAPPRVPLAVNAAPEPGALGLIVAGAGAAFALVRRRRRPV